MELNPVHWARDTRQYLQEVQGEGKKITWPSQKETIAGTISVVVIVAVVTTVLATADFVLSRLVAWVLQ